ncbi:MAG: hypothetical protein JXM69_10000 [Anaerolineae bacterium]|nr:hypothetical protein [Anaerolineae bacterium]
MTGKKHLSEFKIIFLTLSLVSLFVAFAVLTYADALNRAGLVVVHGDGTIVTQCVEFAEAQITGMQLLERSDLDFVNSGGAICQIDHEGCPAGPDCLSCQAPHYWSYWLSNTGDGSWQYAGYGASGRSISDGQVDGWVWGTGSSSPPAVTFAEICGSPPGNVMIIGPKFGITNTVYAFAAMVNPATARQPLSYTWQASAQMPITNVGGLSNTVTYTWNITGAKVMTVYVQNTIGVATGTYTVTIFEELYPIYVPLILK